MGCNNSLINCDVLEERKLYIKKIIITWKMFMGNENQLAQTYAHLKSLIKLAGVLLPLVYNIKRNDFWLDQAAFF